MLNSIAKGDTGDSGGKFCALTHYWKTYVCGDASLHITNPKQHPYTHLMFIQSIQQVPRVGGRCEKRETSKIKSSHTSDKCTSLTHGLWLTSTFKHKSWLWTQTSNFASPSLDCWRHDVFYQVVTDLVWTWYFVNKWIAFAANQHKWFTGQNDQTFGVSESKGNVKRGQS